MEKSELNEQWEQQKDKLKKKFVWLTDNDLLFQDGKYDDLMERLQTQLGKTKEELRKIISEL